ncbi:MAG: VWA domain-containing protein, partial [Phycisphaerae bacterium]|nr:VWA domain-containing protein [Phycisphaerae bacterium]
SFKAGGGGDGPESVNQALHEAVTKMQWSKDKKAYRVIFLVGDYPPHMDYKDDVKYADSCKAAAEAGIVINTIQCGGHGPTVPIWRDIARRAEGRYFKVSQSGSAILASTPFDARLAELSRKLDHTRIFYGNAKILAKQKARVGKSEEIYARASVRALASRAEFNVKDAGRRNFSGIQELADDVKSGRVKLDEVKDKELPKAMQKMSPKERKEFVAKQLAERKRIRAEIKQLSAKRQKHLKEQAKKLKGKPSLDHGVYECIKEQAGERGIEYAEDGPSL